ncbi:MAG: hypothetical protein ACKO3G_01125 [Planctomycetaceae bacterium]
MRARPVGPSAGADAVGGRRRGLTALVLAVMAVACGGRGEVRGQQAGGLLEAVAPDAAEHVFVAGVPDTFDDLRAVIARVKQETGGDYRVLVVGAGPEGDRSARVVLDGILERWGRAAPAGSAAGAFDASKDVLIYVDVGARRLAMHVPSSLESGSGLDPATIERELIAKVFAPRAAEGRVDRGLVDLVEATEGWVRDRREQERRRREAERVFRTRTLPAVAAAIVGLGGLMVLIARRARHGRRVREAREKLAAFKSEVVALSDLLDAQQERHRMLPHSDPDFVTPMEGQSRAAYEGVQRAIARYRERWLSLMDVWEKADETIAAESALGTAKAEEAIRLLEAAESRPPLDLVARDCRDPLDGLEQAHEKARAMAAAHGDLLAATRKRALALAERGRSSASFEGPVAEFERALEAARAEVEPDPLGARARMEVARAALDVHIARLEACEALDDQRRQAAERADALAAAVAARRAEGWLLRERGADPDERLAAARRCLEAAAGLLDAGEPEAARARIEEAQREAADGAALLESVAAARTRVEELLPGAIARLESLAARREATVESLRHLERSYAPESWTDVADNPVKADEGLSRARAMVAEGRAAAQPARQEYFRALALVEEGIRQLDWVDGCHAAVADRRGELDALRGSLPRRAAEVTERVDTLGRRLTAQRTDRLRANEQWREAERLATAATRAMAVDRPHLPQAGRWIDAADAAAEGAERLAADDERLALQGVAGIEEADHELRRARGWYAEGLKADVSAAEATLAGARTLLSRQRYEDAIRAAGEARRLAQEALAEASAAAERRRRERQLEAQRRQMEDSFVRMSRGSGPWVVQLPGGTFSGPDPWRTVAGGGGRPSSAPGGDPPSRSASGQWNSRTAEGSW